MADDFPTRQLINSDTGMLEWLTGRGYSDAACRATNIVRNNYARALARLRLANSEVKALYDQCSIENSISPLTEEYKECAARCNAAVFARDKAYQDLLEAESVLTSDDVDDAERIIEKVSKYENWKG